MTRLGLVAAFGEFDLEECPSAEKSHPALAVPYGLSGDEPEESAREPVRQAASPWHRREVAEAVTDDELRISCRREKGANGCRGVLAVRVEHEHRLGRQGALKEVAKTGGNCVALARVGREAQERHARLRDESLNGAGLGLGAAVVDEQNVTDSLTNLLDERARGRLAVAGHERRDTAWLEPRRYWLAPTARNRCTMRAPPHATPRPIASPSAAPARTSSQKCTPR